MKKISRKRKFGGVAYCLAHVNLYKNQAEHYADAVRQEGGLARVVPGSCSMGALRIKHCWRVYVMEKR